MEKIVYRYILIIFLSLLIVKFKQVLTIGIFNYSIACIYHNNIIGIKFIVTHTVHGYLLSIKYNFIIPSFILSNHERSSCLIMMVTRTMNYYTSQVYHENKRIEFVCATRWVHTPRIWSELCKIIRKQMALRTSTQYHILACYFSRL